MSRRLIIVFIVSLQLSGNFPPAVLSESMSAQYKNARIKNDTVAMIHALKFWGDSLSDASNFEKSDSILLQAVGLSQSINSQKETGRIYNILASNESYAGNRPMAMSYYHKALKAFYDLHDADMVAMVMMNMGSEYEYAGNLKMAIAYKLKALKNKISSGKTKNLDYYYQQVGQLFKETDKAKWEFYVRKAYEVSQKLPESRFQTKVAIFNDLGGISKSLGKHHEALAWYDSMLVISIANNYTTGMGTAYSNRSLTLMSLEKYPQAYADILKAIDYAKQSGRIYGQMLGYVHAANILEKLKDFSAAKQYAQKALEMSELHKNLPEEEAQAHLALARIGESTKDWKMAYEHYNAYKEGIDSLRNSEVEKNLHEMELKYQTSEKEKEIERLNLENRLNSLNYARRKSLFVAVIFILLLFAAMMFLWWRRKLSETRKEQAELREKMLRAQMNPHFIFNTLNAINQFVILGNSTEASNYLTSYAKLMRQILENSNEKIISLSDEIEFLHNYLKMQQLRFGSGFEYDIVVLENIIPSNTYIPPMIAQPFIENAIEHGIRGIKDGKISVAFEFIAKELVLTVTDNGAGIQKSKTESEHRSMAIDITLGRILMQGGRPDSLTIESPVPDTQSGTRISIAVPFKIYEA